MKKKLAVVLSIVLILSMFAGLQASAEENIILAPAGSPGNFATMINTAQAGTIIVLDPANNLNNWAFSITATNVTLREGVTIRILEGAALQIGGGAGLAGSLVNNGRIEVYGGLTFHTGASTIHNSGTIYFADDCVVTNNAGANEGHRGQIRLHGNGVLDIPSTFSIVQAASDTVKLVNVVGNTGFRVSMGWANEYWDGVSNLVVRGNYDCNECNDAGCDVCDPPVIVPGEDIAGVTGAAAVAISDTVDFTVWLEPADVLKSVNWFEVTFTVNNNLSSAGLEASIPGFSVLRGDGAWVDLGDDGWQITLEFFSITPVDISTRVELLNASFSAAGLGDATLTLDSVMVIAQADPNIYVDKLDVVISSTDGSFTTNVVEDAVPVPVYSIYDLDRDEKVDGSDVSIALRAFGWIAANAGWDSFVIATAHPDALVLGPVTPELCDVNDDDVVDMLDIADILANYGPAPVSYVF